MRAAHFGTFDVPNYGDLLFPGLVEYELRGVVDEFVHVSPVGGPPVYTDAVTSISVAELEQQPGDIDVVIVGGGNIMHSGASSLSNYSLVRKNAYAGLWIKAAQVAARHRAPLIINAPGVPRRFKGLSRFAARSVVRQAAYVAVRDRASLARLTELGLEGVHVVPDTALNLSAAYRAPDVSKVPHQLEHRNYAAIHVNSRYSGSPADAAASLDALSSALGIGLCLIGIGACHGDAEFATAVGELMRSNPVVLADPQEIATVVDIIRGSVCYIGCSLHGFITATSFGVPALLVADAAAQHKFLGLLEQAEGTNRLLDSWPAAVRAAANNSILFESPLDVDDCRTTIDEHWTAVRQALAGAAGPAGRLTRSGIDLARLTTSIPYLH